MRHNLFRISATLLLLISSSAAAAEETISLFDGKTLDGWVTLDGKPVTQGWRVVDGAIHLKRGERRAGHIRSTRAFENFVLEFEWRIAEGGNSGLKYLAKATTPGGKRYLGCEFQLLDDENHRNGRNALTSAGALYGLYAPDAGEKTLRLSGEFNQSKVVVDNGRVEHWLNGKKILEANIGSEVWRQRINKSKFNDVEDFAVGPGVILLQDHKSEVWFKNIHITPKSGGALRNDEWVVDSQAEWRRNTAKHSGLEIADGMAGPTDREATLVSVIKTFKTKRAAQSIVLEQSPQWLNWAPIGDLGPVNLTDAPVMLSLGPDNYWMFGRYGGGRRRGDQKKAPAFKPQPATLDGFDLELLTTRFPNQFDAPGGLKPRLGGYHAWQSRDMVNWVHHGPITEKFSAWMTTAEYADGKAYFYYDFPNDQDPHVYVDADLFDGIPGDNKGMAYDDPSHGSDCGIIRGLDGRFHLILEDWSPINAQRHAWDSPLAAHAASPDGLQDFKLLAPPVDERTKPTGRIGTYQHPHWVKENPERFETNVAEYEIHEPEQNAYGDWAAICIGGQYYLFCDYDPADSKQMSVGWFTSKSINEPFTWCGNVGEGHPDPDVMFAEGKFYLATQQKMDFVSPGPWVEDVEVRVGVDTDNDGAIDQWTGWERVKERYDYIKGFSKQVARIPARRDLSELPAGYGFQFEVNLKDTTENTSKPILDRVKLAFVEAAAE